MPRSKPRWKHINEEEAVSSPVRQALDALAELCFVMLAVIFVFTFVFRIITVSGTSMLPNFHDGDRVMVSMLGNSYKTGDVVVAVNVLDEPIIKRVIATEGQEVWIDYDAHSTLTTFTLDDAASTIVTVSVSQDGAMEAV